MTVILRYRAVVSVVVIAVTFICAAGIPRISFDDSYREMFRSESDDFRQYEQLLRDFGSDENDCLVLVEVNDVLSSESLSVLREIHNRADAVEDVTQVYSLFAARQPRRVGRYLLPVLPGDLTDAARLEAAREALRNHPLFRGQILSDDGRATLLVVRLDDRLTEASELTPAVENLRKLLAECTADSEVTTQLTGLPVIRIEVAQAVQRDYFVFGSVGLSLSLVVAWFLFRRLTTLAIAIAAPLVGVVWTMGILGWSGEKLNIINSIVPTLVIVIGFTDSVHLMFQIVRERDSGASPHDAVSTALKLVGPACLLTSATTAVGFGSLITMQEPMIRQFGITCAMGTSLALVAVLLVVPLLASTRLGWRCGSRRADGAKYDANVPNIVILWIIKRLIERPALVSSIAAATTVALAIVALRVTPDFRYTENLPDHNVAYAALRKCDRLFGGSAVVNVVAEVPDGISLADAQIAEVLAALHSAFRQQEVFSPPLSLLSVLESLPGESDDPSARVRELRYLPDDVVSRFVNTDQRKLLVTARVPDLGSARLESELTQFQQRLQTIEARFPDYRTQLLGMTVLTTHGTQAMIWEMLYSLGVASVLIFGMLFVSLRSLPLGLASIIPNAFPLLAAAAALVAFDVPLRYSCIMCFSICLGIAVDDTIHVLVTYRRELKRDEDPTAAIMRTMRVIVPVITTTTVLMGIGFGVTVLSSMPTVRLFGVLMSLMLSLALLGDLFLLPAIVCAVARRSATVPRSPSAARAADAAAIAEYDGHTAELHSSQAHLGNTQLPPSKIISPPS